MIDKYSNFFILFIVEKTPWKKRSVQTQLSKSSIASSKEGSLVLFLFIDKVDGIHVNLKLVQVKMAALTLEANPSKPKREEQDKASCQSFLRVN